MIEHRRVAVVLGGYGSFGRLVCRALCRTNRVVVVVAGRDPHAARSFSSTLGPLAQAERIDVDDPDLPRALAQLRTDLVVNTAGPFQSRDYSVPRAAIAAGAHYVDLADARGYVAGIGALHGEARARGVLVVAGASTCPALSTAVVDELTQGWRSLEHVHFGVAPGLRQARGVATARAVLGYCGKAVPILRAGKRATAAGWSGLTRHVFPAPVGARWLSRVDLPEQDLWPERYPALRTLESRASLEPAVQHLGLSALAWLVRVRLLTSLAPHTERLLRIAARLERFGKDAGAMYISMQGRDAAGRERVRTWSIVAEQGDGPWIPVAPAVALAKSLLGIGSEATTAARGAMPCIGRLSSAQILAELSGRAIRTQLDEEALPL